MRALLIAIALCACGDDTSNNKMDAPATSDGPKLADSSGGGDGSPTADAAIMAGAACGSTTCTLGTEECCIGQNNVCKAAGTCPTQAFACDGPEDCPNAVCCFPNSGGSRCQTNNCNAIACHDDGDCPSSATKCCTKSFSPNYGVCQTAC
jgi:hypothetical protein